MEEESLSRKIVNLWLPIVCGCFIGLTIPKLIEHGFSAQAIKETITIESVLATLLVSMLLAVLFRVPIHFFQRKSKRRISG
jgi:hypothetical protein